MKTNKYGRMSDDKARVMLRNAFNWIFHDIVNHTTDSGTIVILAKAEACVGTDNVVCVTKNGTITTEKYNPYTFRTKHADIQASVDTFFHNSPATKRTSNRNPKGRV